jgi:hypothetical protein
VPSAFAPDDITGLISWFAADQITGLSDGSSVATWGDQSSGGRDATQATAADQPIYKTGIVDGKPVVRFADTGDNLTVTAAPSHTATTMFAVLRPPSTSGDYAIWRHDTNGGIEWRISGGKLGLDKRGQANIVNGATTLSTTGFAVAALAADGVTSTYTHYLNGEVDGSVVGGTNVGAGGAFTIGNENTTGNFDIAELIIYNSVLSTTDRDAVTVYLGLKYGIAVDVTNPANYTIHAFDPPTGLPAVVDDGTDQSSTLQTLLDYAKNVYGGGTVTLLKPGAVVKLNTGIVVPSRVKLVSSEDTLLDFTGMSTTGTAITVDDEAFTPLTGLNLVGPESTGSVTGTSKGIDVTGIRLRFRDIKVKDFGRGWDWANSETWLVSVIGGEIERCGTGVYLDNVAATATNAGEGMILDHVTIYNSGRAVNVTGNGVDFKMTNCSIDFCAEFGYINDAWVYFTACHMESQGGTSGTYLFDVRGNSKVSFANCDVIMGEGTTGDLNYLFKHTEGPSNYGNGQAHFANTKIYCKDPDGNDVTQWSEQLVEWPDDSTTTTLDLFTPFPLFWCPVSAHEVAQTFRNTSTTPTMIGCSSPLGNLSFGDLRLTSTPGYKMIRVRFG